MIESDDVSYEKAGAQLANQEVHQADGVGWQQPELDDHPQPMQGDADLLHRRVLTMRTVKVSVRRRDEQNALYRPRHAQHRYNDGEVEVLIRDDIQERRFEYQFVFLKRLKLRFMLRFRLLTNLFHKRL